MVGVGNGRQADVTIRDVARVAEVHISTVSRALDPSKSSLVSPETRQRVLEIAEELGYRPHLVAAGLRRGKTRTVGVVVSDLGNPLIAPFVRGVTQALDQAGYMPLVADTLDEHGRFERVLTHLAARRVDALISSAPRFDDEEATVRFASQGIPVVLATRVLPGSGLPSVRVDDEAGGRLAAEHLLDLGHRDLAQLRGPLDVEPFRARTAGFDAALAEAGVEPVAVARGALEPTVCYGEQVMGQLLGQGGRRPTALFVQNDLLALGAIKALRQAGLHCPGDVSIVGYNDLFFAEYVDPPLTTVRLASYELGRLAGGLALEMIDDPELEARAVVVPPTLIVRESTRPARAVAT